MREELGLSIHEANLRQVGVLQNATEGKRDTIAVFHVQKPDVVIRQGIELAAVDMFDVHALPQETSPATQRRLREFREGRSLSGSW